MFSPAGYLRRKVHIDCKNIQAVTADDEEKLLFEGPGFIEICENGCIKYKMYNRVKLTGQSIKYLNFNISNLREFCRLKAEEYDGIIWYGDTWLCTSWGSDFNGCFVITGNIDQMETVIDYGNYKKAYPVSTYSIYYLDYPRIPFTETLKTHVELGGRVIRQSYRKNLIKVNFHGRDISLEESIDQDYLRIYGKYDYNLGVSSFGKWLMESLNFCVASILVPRMIVKYLDDSIEVFIKETRGDWRCSLIAPFMSDEQSGSFKKAFCSYMNYCAKNDNIKFSLLELSEVFLNICHASNSSQQNFMEALCIGCEYCFNKIVNPCEMSTISKRFLDKIENYIKSISDEFDIDTYQQNRIISFIGGLTYPAPRQKLKLLVEKNIITQKQMQVWLKYRPKLSHGHTLYEANIEEVEKEIAQLICMFYRLVYQIIGYEGDCIDFDENENSFKYVPSKIVVM